MGYVDPWLRGSYQAALGQHAALARVNPEPTPSAYFSEPSHTLDPRLFRQSGRHRAGGAPPTLKRSVSQAIVQRLWHFLQEEGYCDPHMWAHPYLAGSGVSYYWEGHQGTKGDLDVLIDVNFPAFRQCHNVTWSDADIAAALNEKMKAHLWPEMANWRGFEVTYYVNPAPLSSIRPYAAISLLTDEWLVPPSIRPDDSSPKMEESAQIDATRAENIIAKFQSAQRDFTTHAGRPEQINALSQMAQAVKEGSFLFHEVHSNRRLAFSPQGQGWSDWHNYRWQAGKRHGWLPAVAALYRIHAESQQTHADIHGVGDVTTTPQQALLRALRAS